VKLETRKSFGWPATAADTAHPTQGLVVHFDGYKQGLADKDHAECRSYWKATRRFHMGADRGWLDIGYSFAVCVHGVVLEGRGLDHVQAAQPGGNSTWYSCTFMSGPGEKPTTVQLAAFAELRSWLRGKGLGAAIKGHREFVPTDCPGDVLWKMVKAGTILVAAPKPTPAPRLLELKNPLMAGEDVRLLQLALNANAARPRLLVDGRFGTATDKAVRAFQKAHKLTVDGKVGSNTRKAMSL
jgi:hypothetical protein